jgi:hypothetical protein
MDWQVFGGEAHELYLALLKVRCELTASVRPRTSSRASFACTCTGGSAIRPPHAINSIAGLVRLAVEEQAPHWPGWTVDAWPWWGWGSRPGQTACHTRVRAVRRGIESALAAGCLDWRPTPSRPLAARPGCRRTCPHGHPRNAKGPSRGGRGRAERLRRIRAIRNILGPAGRNRQMGHPWVAKVLFANSANFANRLRFRRARSTLRCPAEVPSRPRPDRAARPDGSRPIIGVGSASLWFALKCQ